MAISTIDSTGLQSPLANQSLSSPTLSNPTFTGTATGTVLVSGTAQASTSGTNIDFTGIPSWIKRITVMFSGVSTNGTSNKLIQLGNGSIVSTGYVCSCGYVTTGTSPSTATNGFMIVTGGQAAEIVSGGIIFYLVSGNTWSCSSYLSSQLGNQPGLVYTGGYIVLGSSLDRIRITTVNGTDTFDAGTINILYE